MSSDAIMQFPVIVSKTLSIQDITMACKALEREYGSFVRITISMNANETQYSNPDDFIKRFHSNMDDHYPMKDLIINTADDIYSSNPFNESTNQLEQVNYRKILDDMNTNLIETSVQLYSNPNIKNIIEQYHLRQQEINEVINENGIEIIPFIKLYNYPKILKEVYEYLKKNKDDNKIYTYNSEAYIVKDTDYATRISSIKIMRENTKIKVFETPKIIMMKNISYDNFKNCLESGNIELLKEFVQFNSSCLNEKFRPENYSVFYKLNEAKKYNHRVPTGTSITVNTPDVRVSPSIKVGKTEVNLGSQPINISNNIQQSNNPKPLELKDTLLDNDVKKSNELVPTMIACRVNFNDGKNNVPLDFIIGIKTVAHPVGVDEIIKNLSKGLKEKNAFFNFIRWTTGEIKFFKDFLLNIDGIKDDVISKSNKGSQWWSALKRRKNVAKFKAAFMMRKQILPNATIVVSTEEVTYLKNEYGIDLFNLKTVKDLMSYYFLLGFVILDPSTELSYFIFDGYSGYQTFSYNALERENTNTAKEIKNIMTVLGKL